jgi:hypothetical protein
MHRPWGRVDAEWELSREEHEQNIEKNKAFRAATLAAIASGQLMAPRDAPEYRQSPKVKHRRYY